MFTLNKTCYSDITDARFRHNHNNWIWRSILKISLIGEMVIIIYSDDSDSEQWGQVRFGGERSPQSGVALEHNIAGTSLQNQSLSVRKIYCQTAVDETTPPDPVSVNLQTHHGTGYLSMNLEHQLQGTWEREGGRERENEREGGRERMRGREGGRERMRGREGGREGEKDCIITPRL